MFEGIVEAFVEGAEVDAVRRDVERALVDALDRIDGVDDFEDRELVSRFREPESAAEAAAGIDETGAAEHLEHLGEVAGRYLGGSGDPLGGGDFAIGLGDGDDGPKCVLGGR